MAWSPAQYRVHDALLSEAQNAIWSGLSVEEFVACAREAFIETLRENLRRAEETR